MYLDLEIATSFACYRKRVWMKPDFFYLLIRSEHNEKD